MIATRYIAGRWISGARYIAGRWISGERYDLECCQDYGTVSEAAMDAIARTQEVPEVAPILQVLRVEMDGMYVLSCKPVMTGEVLASLSSGGLWRIAFDPDKRSNQQQEGK